MDFQPPEAQDPKLHPPAPAPTPNLLSSLLPVLLLISLLIANITLFGGDAALGPNQFVLLVAGMAAMAIGVWTYKQPYKKIESQIVTSISLSLQAVLILILVGALIGLWILSGVVPTMIYYGLKLINPTIFLPVACIICCIVSISTGSSWSTSGTVGIALIGIGKALGIPDGMIAGAIISGAYFGDKLSPLSDTTNLAPAMAGTDLFTHVRHMMYTTIPAITIAITGFFILGIWYHGGASSSTNVDQVLQVMQSNFNITPWLFLVPIIVIAMIVKKMPAIPAMLLAILISILAAVIFQQDLMAKFLATHDKPFTSRGVFEIVVMAASKGFGSNSAYSFQTELSTINELFNRGGMFGMMNTVWLILMAMIFGGTMEGTGMLQKIAFSIMRLVRNTGTLIGATLASAIFVNIVACDQYLAILLPGRMYRTAFLKFGLHPKNLSRALEDAGTVTSVLIPWNSCAAYNSGVLGVDTLTYLPYCFFNLSSPLISGFCAGFNITITKMTPEEIEQQQKLEAEAAAKVQ